MTWLIKSGLLKAHAEAVATRPVAAALPAPTTIGWDRLLAWFGERQYS